METPIDDAPDQPSPDDEPPRMRAAVARAVGRTWTDGTPWSFLSGLTELGDRLGGSPGERTAADLVVDAFVAAGLGPHLQSFELQAWHRGSASLSVSVPRGDGTLTREFETVALPYSPAGDLEAPLVDVGYGTPDEVDATDVEGAVAVASTTTPGSGRFVHRMEKYGHAIEAGAVGFVFANHIPGQLPPTGSLRFGEEGAIPGVGVSKETGAWLTDYAAEGATVELDVDASTDPGTSQNVVATLGPDTDEEVLVLAHYDAHDIAEGALDNGCGIATLVTALPLLSTLDLDRQVRVAAVGCEEIGLMGAAALADSLRTDRIAGVVNIDGAGRARNLKAYTHGSDGVRELAERVAADAGQPLVVSETPHSYSDHWPFLREGVPSVQLHSESPDGPERGRGWGHTHADTRDKVDVRDVREHAVLTALLVGAMTSAELDRVAPETLAGQLRDADAERGMRAAGLWPTDWE